MKIRHALALVLSAIVVTICVGTPTKSDEAKPAAGIGQRALGLITALRAVVRGQAVRPAQEWGDSFKTNFGKGIGYRWSFSDGYSNGQPFNTGWSRAMHQIRNGGLSLFVKKIPFEDYGSDSGEGNTYPYTSGEVRSNDFYGAGCYSTCMRPSGRSGVSSSFYIHSGNYDVPPGFEDRNPLHNEVDVEFIGVDTTKVQTNFFSRVKDPKANSGSGNEEFHSLGFNAAKSFHMYGFKWTNSKIEWYVDGKKIRTVFKKQADLPSPDYSPMRVVANIWPVNKQAEEWAGKLDKSFYKTDADYKWIQYRRGDYCRLPSKC